MCMHCETFSCIIEDNLVANSSNWREIKLTRIDDAMDGWLEISKKCYCSLKTARGEI